MPKNLKNDIINGMRYYLARMYGNSVGNCKPKIFGRLFRFPERCKKSIAALDKKVGKSYSYRFDDGWWVGIEIEALSSEKEFKDAKRNLSGELGYGWMIDNILDHDSPRDVDAKFMMEVLDGEHLDL